MNSVTEVHAYVHILKELKTKKGWKGKIYTQNECNNNKYLKEQLKGGVPENIVQIANSKFYVIEAKSKRVQLEKAIEEAIEYSNNINQGKFVSAPFCTGIAGNVDEGYVATSRFLKDGTWEVITENNSEVTALLSATEVEQVLSNDNPNMKDVEISEEDFLRTAEEINGILHENAIHKDARAKFISAILLSMTRKPEIDLDLSPPELVGQINQRVDLVLKAENKSEFSPFIHIDLPSSEDNHLKLRSAIVKTTQELLGLNIHSAMRSGKDVLGKFYEVFLKYGNGAKEIGIVLTPRHITRLAAEVTDISANDLVLDPTCGTGGFLVAAFDEVKKKASDKDFQRFRRIGLYGIEEQDTIVALALVNMIFRGDGKNNIIEGNCFRKYLTLKSNNGEAMAEYLNEDIKGRVPPITKVLMNPPFPKKKNDKKEFLFIEQALKQMQDEGLLFSVLPYSCMIRGGAYLSWRERMLKENTLLSVISFPPELFSPVGVRAVGIFIRKGIPHGTQKVLWIRALHDGFKLKKGKRLPTQSEPNDLEKIMPLLKSFIADPSIDVHNIPRFQKESEIKFPKKNETDDDKEFELCPEAYLDDEPITSDKIRIDAEALVRENVAFLIRGAKEDEKNVEG